MSTTEVSKRTSLATKLNLPNVIVGIVVTLLVVTLVASEAKNRLEHTIKDKTRNIVSSLFVATDQQFSSNNLSRVISTLAARPDILELSIIHPRKGTIVAHTNHSLVDKSITLLKDPNARRLMSLYIDHPKRPPSPIEERDTLYQVINVNLVDPELNRLRPFGILLVVDLHNIKQDTLNQPVRILALLIFGIITTLITNLLVQRYYLINPLKQLVNHIGKQQAHNDYVEIPIFNKDEIGELATEYNRVNTIKAEKDEELRKARWYIDSITQKPCITCLSRQRV